jgi:hypothetical protein
VPEFTSLEKIVLQNISALATADQPALNMQLATAEVLRRENSGSGFFTYFSVNRAIADLVTGERLRSGTHAYISGYDYPMGFILWFRGGYADCLEGFLFEGTTLGVDLASLNFIKFEDYNS